MSRSGRECPQTGLSASRIRHAHDLVCDAVGLLFVFVFRLADLEFGLNELTEGPIAECMWQLMQLVLGDAPGNSRQQTALSLFLLRGCSDYLLAGRHPCCSQCRL